MSFRNSLCKTIDSKEISENLHTEKALNIGKRNGQVRPETAIAALGPTIEIIAPWRLWGIASREETIVYAQSKNVDLKELQRKKVTQLTRIFFI